VAVLIFPLLCLHVFVAPVASMHRSLDKQHKLALIQNVGSDCTT
jgi:hypothetical protein